MIVAVDSRKADACISPNCTEDPSLVHEQGPPLTADCVLISVDRSAGMCMNTLLAYMRNSSPGSWSTGESGVPLTTSPAHVASRWVCMCIGVHVGKFCRIGCNKSKAIFFLESPWQHMPNT